MRRKPLITLALLVTAAVPFPQTVAADEAERYLSRHRTLKSASEARLNGEEPAGKRNVDVEYHGGSGRGCAPMIAIGSIVSYGGIRARSLTASAYVRNVRVNVKC